MSATVDTLFSEWLIAEMDRRGWSQSDLARAAGLNRQVISGYINQKRMKPDEEIVSALARALGYPPETVFRAAGLLPPVAPPDEKRERLFYMFDELTQDQQDQLLAFADFLKRNEPARSKIRTTKSA